MSSFGRYVNKSHRNDTSPRGGRMGAFITMLLVLAACC
jgi:hypothetical protein